MFLNIIDKIIIPIFIKVDEKAKSNELNRFQGSNNLIPIYGTMTYFEHAHKKQEVNYRKYQEYQEQIVNLAPRHQVYWSCTGTEIDKIL